MYYTIGWPKSVKLSFLENLTINHICCDAVKILFAAAGDDFLGIYYSNPLIPITFYKRSAESVKTYGANKFIVWKPDSRQICVLTKNGLLLLYQIDCDTNSGGIFNQIDPPSRNLKRDSAELFIKENIPRLSLRELSSIRLESTISAVSCISLTELLVATYDCHMLRIQWQDLDVTTNNVNNNVNLPDTSVDLRSIPFYVNRGYHLKNIPAISTNAFVSNFEYSPFIGGCAAVFTDNRAAFIVATHLRFEADNMHGFWVPDVEDATICSVNHKFRLLAYGRCNSDVDVFAIEDTTGGLEFSHRLSLNTNVLPGSLGNVIELKWSPDGCVLAVCWENGGIALWSTFGALLMSSLSWDFGLQVDLAHFNPLKISRLEWSIEGYQLYLTCKTNEHAANSTDENVKNKSNVLQMNFVKSTLTMNPCMTSQPHLLLQGDDTLYLNQGDNLEITYFGSKLSFPNNDANMKTSQSKDQSPSYSIEINNVVDISSILAESKYWTVLQLPLTYASTNWPIRYSAIDSKGEHLAVAGRTGMAHYSMITKKWKLFGNESQEKDFVVSGGLLWWMGFVVMGCYSLLDRTDEIRCYPHECKLDNQYGNKIQVRAPVISLNMFRDQLIVLTADGIVSLFLLTKRDAYTLSAECAYEIDVKSICIHPACIVSLMITNLRNDLTTKTVSSTSHEVRENAETIIVNVCGRILMIQRDFRNSVGNSLMASCLASCVECFWLSNGMVEKSPMRDCLWLYSGAHGMRVWLPILPPTSMEKIPDRHTFMSKRIMLSFPLKLYPLVILFDNVIVLGVENETTLFTSETSSHFSLPFSLLERKSQVYLHKVLRQLIKRNLGYSAWEIAKSCRSLPYFPHSLELLLHEVLEEEATSKEPIPDALLPSVLDFIREFPVYLQTIVQCARKTEIALWPYLFSMAGKPKELFQQCLQLDELQTAASYLIILQNLEPSSISKQYATLLLDIALRNSKWDLAKDLIRFLKAIDPNEIDSPRSSMVFNVKIAPPSQNQSQVNQNPDAFNLVLGPMRERSYSTTVISNLPKDKFTTNKPLAATISTPPTAAANSSVDRDVTNQQSNNNASVSGQTPTSQNRRKSEKSCGSVTKDRKETFCIEIILQKHALKLLQNYKLLDLGYMSAFLDFHFVTWLTQESLDNRLTKIDDFVKAIVILHEQLKLPSPIYSESIDEGLNLQLLNQASLYNHDSSRTSESGYVSLALMETPTSVNNDNAIVGTTITSIKENEELQNVSPVNSRLQQQNTIKSTNKRHNSKRSDLSSISTYAFELCVPTTESRSEVLPGKLSIKLRYLLQLFIEANCTDYALLLSIVLQDAASIGRIINMAIRLESLECGRIESALKSLTQWSFERDCLYRAFMQSLQPHIYQMEQFLNSCPNKSTLRNFDELEEVNNKSTDNVDEDINQAHKQEHRRSLTGPQHNQQFKRQLSLQETSISYTQKVNTGHTKEEISAKEPGACIVM